jgi:hypothetical protein
MHSPSTKSTGNVIPYHRRHARLIIPFTVFRISPIFKNMTIPACLSSYGGSLRVDSVSWERASMSTESTQNDLKFNIAANLRAKIEMPQNPYSLAFTGWMYAKKQDRKISFKCTLKGIIVRDIWPPFFSSKVPTCTPNSHPIFQVWSQIGFLT